MKKLIVLTLLMLIAMPVFAATDWDEFESGRDNIRLDGYQGQPGYIQFADGSGTNTAIIYWNATAGEFYALTPDERDTAVSLGTPSSGKNVGISLSVLTSTTRP